MATNKGCGAAHQLHVDEEKKRSDASNTHVTSRRSGGQMVASAKRSAPMVIILKPATRAVCACSEQQ